MKLSELAIESTSIHRGIQIGPLHPQLNIVHSDSVEALSLVVQLIRGILFGPHADGFHSYPSTVSFSGSLLANRNLHHYRLTRPLIENGRMDVEGMENAPRIQSTEELFGPVDRHLFDGLFHLNFGRLTQHLAEIPVLFERRLRGNVLPSRFRTQQEYLEWQAAATLRRRQLAEQRNQLIQLDAEQLRLRNEIDVHRRTSSAERERLEKEVRRLENSIEISRKTLEPLYMQLSGIDQQIADLRLLITRRSQDAELVASETSTETPLSALYAHLDEVDQQISSWRQVQQGVQDRRLHLRDEMVTWSELTMDSDDHPYHSARLVLLKLEEDLNRVERSSKVLEQAPPQSNYDPREFATGVLHQCDEMRIGLHSLCEELGKQYKTIRHRAAVTEFKQLRRCFNEIAENIDLLLERRSQIIHSIQQWDSIGAEAILVGEQEFLRTAASDGFLAARRRFHGAEPTKAQRDLRSIAPALTREQNELESLNSRRESLRREIGRLDGAMHLELQQVERLQDQIRNAVVANVTALNVQLEKCAADALKLKSTADSLALQVAEDERIPQFVEHSLVTRSAVNFATLWNDEPRSLRISPDGRRLQASINWSDYQDIESFDLGIQQSALLACALAGCALIRERGGETPMLIEQLTAIKDIALRERCLRMLNRAGQQTIVLDSTRNEDIDWSTMFPPEGARLFQIGLVPILPTEVAVQNRVVNPDSPSQDINWRERNLVAYMQPQLQPFVYSDAIDLRPAPVSYVEPSVGGRPNTMSHAKENLHSEAMAPEFAGRPYDDVKIAEHTLFRTSSGRSLVSMSEETSLRNVDLVDLLHLNNLYEAGVTNIRSLLQLDPEDLPLRLKQLGIMSGQIDRWQSQAWLMLCVPGMVPSEARLLIACGILEPEQLETTHADQLLARINRYLASPDGQRLAHGATRFEIQRINEWHRGLSATRSHWRQSTGYSRRQRRTANSRENPVAVEPGSNGYFSQNRTRNYEPGMRYFEPASGEEENVQVNRSIESPRPVTVSRERDEQSQKPFESRERMEPRSRRPTNPSSDSQDSVVNREPKHTAAEKPVGVRSTEERQREIRRMLGEPTSERTSPPKTIAKIAKDNSPVAEELKFYLNLEDPIEAAPSIGPKTAEKFTAVKIHTINDFLKMNAEAMADLIDYKRITANVIRTWQDQTRLVCRIPNLRAHDAQLLVGCGIFEPEELATMNPKKLISLVGPFADTKEGLKIIRSGKKPDLEEVTDWINWAKHTRSLQAA